MIKIDNHINILDFPSFQYPHCNCLWIADDINCLIDTSPSLKDLEYLLKNPVDLIINTHGHMDHYMFNHYFPNSKIMMHQADHGIAQSADTYLDKFGFKTYNKNPDMNRLILEGLKYRTTKIDESIEDKQVINLGTTSFETLHLPGHSPGHCGFWFPEQGFVYTADIDLSEFGPWYGNLNCSLPEFLQSIERLLNMKPDYIVTGHGGPIVKEHVISRLKGYRDIIYARQRRIMELIHRGHHTLEEIARAIPIYLQLPRPKALFYVYEQVMITIHLRYLQELGYITQEGLRYYLKEGIHPSRISI